MGNWGIADTAPEKEKIKADFNDFINGLNSVTKIDYETYSELFDEGMKLLDKMYELGKKKPNREVSLMTNCRVRCEMCGWVGMDSQVSKVHDLDSDNIWSVCPECRIPENFIMLCNHIGCKNRASFINVFSDGTPSTQTCFEHSISNIQTNKED